MLSYTCQHGYQRESWIMFHRAQIHSTLGVTRHHSELPSSWKAYQDFGWWIFFNQSPAKYDLPKQKSCFYVLLLGSIIKPVPISNLFQSFLLKGVLELFCIIYSQAIQASRAYAQEKLANGSKRLQSASLTLVFGTQTCVPESTGWYWIILFRPSQALL